MPLEEKVARAGSFVESKHPRENTGKFTDKPGGAGAAPGEANKPDAASEATANAQDDGEKKKRKPARVDPVSSGEISKLGVPIEDFDDLTGIGALEDQGIDMDKKVMMLGGVRRDGSAVVHVKAVSKDGQTIISRKLYYGAGGKPDSIENQVFFMDEKLAGQGLGTKVFAHEVSEASKKGFKKIKTLAGRNDNPEPGDIRMNGYYTWPRLGYDATVKDAIAKSAPKEVHDSLASRQSASKGPFKPSSYLVSDFMKSKEGRDYWKQNGQQMEMSFDLSEGSQSRRVLDEYTKAKGIRKEWLWLLN